MTMVLKMKYGYYLAESDKCCGDIELAAEAQRIYQAHYALPNPQRPEGISIFSKGEKKIIRMVVMDFFAETRSTMVVDLDENYKVKA